MRIFIDPGHSGNIEPGTCHFDFKECDIVLSVSKKIEQFLVSLGHCVKLYRTSDILSTSLTERAKQANDFQTDFFLSVHCNAFVKNSVRGTEAFYFPESIKGQAFASEIVENLCDLTGFTNRGAKPETFTVLSATNAPAVLLELGFLSNFQEAVYLADESLQTAIAASIADTINYLLSC